MKTTIHNLRSLPIAAQKLKTQSSSALGHNDVLKDKIKSLSAIIALKIKAINGLVLRNKGRALLGVLLKDVRAARPHRTKSVVRQVAVFSFLVHRLVKHSGFKGAVLYLKACQVLLQQVVGGFRVSNIDDLKVRPKRNKAGLPLVIPAGVRVLISKDRHIPTIRLWMTLFGLFRIMEFKGKFSLSTIMDYGLDLHLFLPRWKRFVSRVFVPALLRRIRQLPPVTKPKIFPVAKSGPTTHDTPLVNSSGWALTIAARLWMRSPSMLKKAEIIAKELGAPAIINRMRLVSMSSHKVLDSEYWMPFWRPGWDFSGAELANKTDLRKHQVAMGIKPTPISGQGFLGKLGLKIEPAGKVRVFAMVDAWTQWLLSPIHDFIFNILKQISDVDGTFNQLHPLSRLQKEFANKAAGRRFYSIDLSAATDRLPVALQSTLLEPLLKRSVPNSKELARAWEGLLTDRPYKVSISGTFRRACDVAKDVPRFVWYKVGQPMGALSSWPMLAIVHHAIVQFAAYRARRTLWFDKYAVLGDDVFIADGRVAGEYQKILQEIGVKAGLAKSIVAKSRFVAEFAKKFFVDSSQANMVPIKECVATRCSTSMVMEFCNKYNLSLNAILAFLGFGYKARMYSWTRDLFSMSTRLRVLLVWLTIPGGPFGCANYYDWLCQKTLREKHTPSLDVQGQVLEMLVPLEAKRIAAYTEAVHNYLSYSDRVFDQLDRTMPVKVMHAASLTNDRGITLSPHSWSKILDSDMSSKTILDLDDPDTTPQDRYDKELFKNKGVNDLVKPLFEEHVDSRYKRLMHFVETANPSGSSARPEDWIHYRIEEFLRPDVMTTSLPKDQWKEERPELRRFTDFMMVYKLWQDWSKPIWAEYYKSRENSSGEAPKEGLESVQDTVSQDDVSVDGPPIDNRRPAGFWTRIGQRLDQLPEFDISRWEPGLLNWWIFWYILYCLMTWNIDDVGLVWPDYSPSLDAWDADSYIPPEPPRPIITKQDLYLARITVALIGISGLILGKSLHMYQHGLERSDGGIQVDDLWDGIRIFTDS